MIIATIYLSIYLLFSLPYQICLYFSMIKLPDNQDSRMIFKEFFTSFCTTSTKIQSLSRWTTKFFCLLQFMTVKHYMHSSKLVHHKSKTSLDTLPSLLPSKLNLILLVKKVFNASIKQLRTPRLEQRSTGKKVSYVIHVTRTQLPIVRTCLPSFAFISYKTQRLTMNKIRRRSSIINSFISSNINKCAT
jgi:hypothetical protein